MLVAALLHFGFVFGEMYPFDENNSPLLLKSLSKVRVEEGKDIHFSTDEKQFVGTIVRNAGIYNFILAIGMAWMIFPDKVGPSLPPESIKAFRCYLLLGALVAGIFGITLSYATLIQAAVGAIGVGIILFRKQS